MEVSKWPLVCVLCPANAMTSLLSHCHFQGLYGSTSDLVKSKGKEKQLRRGIQSKIGSTPAGETGN